LQLQDLISNGTTCFIEETQRDAAIRTMVAHLARSSKEITSDQLEKALFESILKREKIVSTGIGMGIAIPHAKLPCFKTFFMGLGIVSCKKGIEWDSLDGFPVRIIFLIGGPQDNQTDYLQILSHLTSAVKDEDRRQQLLDTKNLAEIPHIFAGC